jgi:hypothetical protein
MPKTLASKKCGSASTRLPRPLEELKMTSDEALPKEDERESSESEVEVLEIEDDLDTGMHRINVCQPGF